MSLPSEFVERFRRIHGETDSETLLEFFHIERPTSFRVNTLKTTMADAIAELSLSVTALPISDRAFWVDAKDRSSLTHSHAINEGHIYIQDPASMLAPFVLNPLPDESILDLAAAPGSKTTQIADLMSNTGSISAVEISKPRFFKLQETLKRMGVTNTKTFLKNGDSVGRLCPNRFDRVLVDAPCSTEAKFTTRDPESCKYWSLKKIDETSRKQWRLLLSGLEALRPGGLLVYSTCSFSPEENECVVHRMLERLGDAIELLPISLPISNTRPGLLKWERESFHPSLERTIRILPNELMEGLYIACIRKHRTFLKLT